MHSEILGENIYGSGETHQRLIIPPWLAIANATRSGANNLELEKIDYDPSYRQETADGDGDGGGDGESSSDEDRPMSPPQANSPFQRRKLPRNTEIYLHGEKAQASVAIQKNWRGFITRVKIWRFGGLGTHYMVEKIQRRYRGVLGRRRAAQRWLERGEYV